MSVFDLNITDRLPHSSNWPASRTAARSEPLVARMFSVLSQRLHEWKYRRTLIGLLGYSDATLEDMGTSRGELLEAINLPLSVDACSTLAQWKAERNGFAAFNLSL